MFLKLLFNKLGKLSVNFKIVFSFLIILFIWMLSSALQSKKNSYHTNEVNENIKYKVTESFAVSKAKILEFTGITEAEKQVDLVSELNGKVTAIFAKEGQKLKKGDKIIQIEQKNYLQMYNAAEENVTSKEVLYQSALQLRKKGLGSEADVANAKSQLYTANAELKQASLNFNNATIKAPYDGFIDKINVKIDTYLIPGFQVGTFLSNKIIKVKFHVSNDQFNDVKNSVAASLLINGKKVIVPKVESLSDIADNITKTYSAEILADNTDCMLRSGEVVRVLINVGNFPSHKISQSTISIDANGQVGVKILDKNDIVRFIPVEIIGEDTDAFWVTNLPDSAKIITLGHFYVMPGDKLN